MKRPADMYYSQKRPAMEKRPEPLLYGRHRLSEADLFARIRSGILAPRLVWSGDLCWNLRKAVGVLMGTPELRFADIDGDGAVESDGFLEDHVDVASQARLLKIVDSMTAAFICFAGIEQASLVFLDFGKEPGAWFVRNCHNPLEWATAVAVFREEFPTARALLAMYVPTNIKNGPRCEAGRYRLPGVLSLAVKNCSCEMVTLLLEHGANVNQEVYMAPLDTPLRVACQRGSLGMVKMILSPGWGLREGGDFLHKDKFGVQPDFWHWGVAISYAARCPCTHRDSKDCDERIAIINLLISRKKIADIQDLMARVLAVACTWGCKSITRMLLDTGTCPNSIGPYGIPALLCAAIHGHVELMEFLLERGAPHLSIFFPPNSLWFYEEAANADMMKYLYDRGAAIMKWGPLDQAKAEFILGTAAEKNCSRVIELLVRAGFDLRKGCPEVQALQNALFSSAINSVNVLTDC